MPLKEAFIEPNEMVDGQITPLVDVTEELHINLTAMTRYENPNYTQARFIADKFKRNPNDLIILHQQQPDFVSLRATIKNHLGTKRGGQMDVEFKAVYQYDEQTNMRSGYLFIRRKPED